MDNQEGASCGHENKAKNALNTESSVAVCCLYGKVVEVIIGFNHAWDFRRVFASDSGVGEKQFDCCLTHEKLWRG